MALNLYNVRNFYSLTAVLQGLREAGADKRIPSRLALFIETNENYAGYRQMFWKKPGLPFLLPHLQFSKSRSKDLSNVFARIAQYNGEPNPPLGQLFVSKVQRLLASIIFGVWTMILGIFERCWMARNGWSSSSDTSEMV